MKSNFRLPLVWMVVVALVLSLVPIVAMPSTASAATTVKLSTGKVNLTKATAGIQEWIAGTGFISGAVVTLSASAGTLALSTTTADAVYDRLGTGRVALTALTFNADDLGNFVVKASFTHNAAAAITLTATDGTNTDTDTLTIVPDAAWTQAVLITRGAKTAYADPTTQANIFNFVKVGDSVAVASVGADFTPGGPISLVYDGVAQTVLGNTSVISSASVGTIGTFSSAVKVAEGWGATQVLARDGFPPGKDRTLEISDSVSKVYANVWTTPKSKFSVSTGARGTTQTVSGTGFAKSKGITAFSSAAQNAVVQILSDTATISGSPVVVTGAGSATVTAGTLIVTILGTSTVTFAGALVGTASFSQKITVVAGTLSWTATRYTPAQVVSSGTIVTDGSGNFSGTFKTLGDSTYFSIKDGDGNWDLNILKSDETSNRFSAKPTVTLSPSSGKPGDTITVSGSDFNASLAVRLFFGAEATNYNTPGSIASSTSDSSGQVNFTFVVPNTASAGSNTVHVIDSNDKNNTATLTGATLPMTATPTSVPRYGKITLSVSNMTPSGTIPVNQLTMAGAAWNTVANAGLFVSGIASTGVITLDSSGAATFTLRVDPTASVAANEVSAVDSGGRIAKTYVTVAKPTITMTPTSAVRNQVVIIRGTGWVSEESVAITIGTGTNQRTVNATPGADGSIVASFTVPTAYSANTDYTVSASDGTSRGNTTDTIILKVPAAAITVTPAKAAWGATVTVSGTGFKGGIPMRIMLPWDAVLQSGGGLFPTAVYSDSAGAFSGTFTLPTVEKGIQTLGASDGVVSGTATLEVVESAVTVGGAMANISTQLVRVWGYDAATATWKLYDPAAPALSDLATLVKGKGYWINVKAATQLTYRASSWDLVAGWNLIGWTE